MIGTREQSEAAILDRSCHRLVLLLAWFLTADVAGWIDRQRFPSPSDVLAAGTQIVTRGYAGGTLLTRASDVDKWFIALGEYLKSTGTLSS